MSERPSQIPSRSITGNGQIMFLHDNAAAVEKNGYDWITVQSVGTFVATITFDVSNDGITWLGVSNLYDVTNKTQPVSTITATNKIFFLPIHTRYVRARSTTYTSGTAGFIVMGGYGPSVFNIPTDQQAVSINISPTAGGYTSHSNVVSAATTNATSVKSSSGNIGSIILTNTSASMKYFKLYNKASAPTVGTDTPIMTVGIPATSNVSMQQSAGLRL